DSIICKLLNLLSFFFSSRRRHTRFSRDWSSDVCSSDLQSFAGARDGAEQRCTRVFQAAAVDIGVEVLLELVVTGHFVPLTALFRSEECRVGKECRCLWSTCVW